MNREHPSQAPVNEQVSEKSRRSSNVAFMAEAALQALLAL